MNLIKVVLAIVGQCIIPRVLSLEHLGREPNQGGAGQSWSEYYPSSFKRSAYEDAEEGLEDLKEDSEYDKVQNWMSFSLKFLCIKLTNFNTSWGWAVPSSG